MGMTDVKAARLGRTISLLARNVELAVAGVGLSPAQYRLLSHLDDSPANGRVLADKLLVTPPTLTAVVDGLVARDLVERSNDPNDRRRVAHALTADGRRALAAAHVAVGEQIEAILASTRARDRARALEGFEVWHDALAEYIAVAAATPE